MGLRVLPPGMIGVLLAAMLASSMASLSAYNHIITGIFAKDIYQGYLRRDASDRHMLTASRITSLGVGLVIICVALLFVQGATGIFTLLFILESMFPDSAWLAPAIWIPGQKRTMVVRGLCLCGRRSLRCS
jgi:Na+/proline symporter